MTISEIARLAGVSTSTVSRVFSHHPNIREDVRARVLAGVMPRFAERLHIERAVLGNNAGMIGAAKYFMDREAERT